MSKEIKEDLKIAKLKAKKKYLQLTEAIKKANLTNKAFIEIKNRLKKEKKKFINTK